MQLHQGLGSHCSLPSAAAARQTLPQVLMACLALST